MKESKFKVFMIIPIPLLFLTYAVSFINPYVFVGFFTVFVISLFIGSGFIFADEIKKKVKEI